MNLKKLFAGSELLPAQDKAKLEALDKACQPQREWLEKLRTQMPESREARQTWLEVASGEFATNPGPETFAKVQKVGLWGDRTGDDYATVFRALENAIQQKMASQREIIAGVLKRYLATLEKQYEATMTKEQKESQEFGIEFKPSGIVRGLEMKIMETRNRIANGDGRHWREALAELL